VYEFSRQYSIPDHLQAESLAHVQPRTDPVLYQQRLAREQKQAADARRMNPVQVPSWKSEAHTLYTKANVKAMRSRLIKCAIELGGTPTAAAAAPKMATSESKADDGDAEEEATGGDDDEEKKDPHALSSHEFTVIDSLMTNIADQTNYHAAAFPVKQLLLIKRLMAWPSAKCIVPVLDAARCLMCHSAAVRRIGTDAAFLGAVLKHAAATESDTARGLLLKLFANWIAKRPKSSAELKARNADSSDAGAAVPAYVAGTIAQALKVLTPATAQHATKESLVQCLVMFCHNVVRYLGKNPKLKHTLFPALRTTLASVLKGHAALSDKTKYFLLLTLGSIAFVDSPSRKAFLSDALLKSVVSDAAASNVAVLRNVAGDFGKICAGDFAK
jgi:hypothetical protein